MTGREGMQRQKARLARILPWRWRIKRLKPAWPLRRWGKSAEWVAPLSCWHYASARVCKESGMAMGARYGKRPIAVGTGALGVIALLWGAGVAGRQNDAADEVAATIRPEAIRAEMRFLADDLLEGRGTGTRGHEIAAKFMASEFEAMGLEPAGENGTYFQSVPLRSIRPQAEDTTVSLMRGGKEQALLFSEDFVTAGDPGRTDTSVEAPVVHAGFGVSRARAGLGRLCCRGRKGENRRVLVRCAAALRSHDAGALQLERCQGSQCFSQRSILVCEARSTVGLPKLGEKVERPENPAGRDPQDISRDQVSQASRRHEPAF
jgi:hypothetical protein